ncbi:protein-disulfide reductase DsbD family protein [Saccharospirillum impatiens]|uniref:protein-disulfide reductase DsbD family protein n=1 Tax=Saccharospirillum impatiens TaxID=169438 RepID=UPI000412A92B|nr:protein-disulfide reductase DsbD [Saccharospirillum impatiens]
MIKHLSVIPKLCAVLLVSVAVLGNAIASEFLPVDEAFELTVERSGDQLSLHWDIADEYYLYRDQHRVDTREGAEVGGGQLSFNVIERYDETFQEIMPVYYDTMTADYPILADQGVVEVVYQGCADAGLCYPPQTRVFDINGNAMAMSVSGTSGSSPLGSAPGGAFDTTGQAGSNVASLSLALALVFALLGGMVLNLMPCVFPVLSLKAMHLAQWGQDTHHSRLHGWIYTLGVVLSFMAVAAVLLLLRQFGTWVGWGFQLQSPFFVAGLILLFYVLALAMAGYVEVGQRLMGAGQTLTQKPGASGTFFTGVLATLVATPCTAPFMGSAIGFALLQPPAIGLLIFATMGFGMALPILAITYLPGLARRLPKPGAWMNVFRQLMAFPLFATVLWLLWVLIEIQGTTALLSVGIGLILLTMAIWPALTVSSANGFLARFFKRGLRVALVAFAFVMVFDQRQQIDIWQPYDAAMLDSYQMLGQPVFLDVTAAWCITCKANERVALSGDRFETLVKKQGVQLMKADWTNPSPEVDALIARFDRQGVPLYAYFPGDGGPVQLLPQVLTPGLIERTFSAS